MPTVTADTLTLPRVRRLDPDLVSTGRRRRGARMHSSEGGSPAEPDEADCPPGEGVDPDDLKIEPVGRPSVEDIFGDVSSRVTSDERGGSPDWRDGDRDEWLRGEVPPHH